MRGAWRDALSAFRQRRAQRLAEEKLEELIDGKLGFCPLIHVEDSYDAGNCTPGTETWMKQVGLSGRKLAPLSEVYQLAKETGERLAINAVKVAAERAAEAAGIAI